MTNDRRLSQLEKELDVARSEYLDELDALRDKYEKKFKNIYLKYNRPIKLKVSVKRKI